MYLRQVVNGWPQDSVIDLGDIISARCTGMPTLIWLRLLGKLGHTDFNFHIQIAGNED